MPDAYKLPIMAPALVPVMMSSLIPFCSSTFMTPICANPFAAPPPNARAIFGFFIGLAGSIGLVPHPVNMIGNCNHYDIYNIRI